MTNPPVLNIYVGFDPNERVAFHALCQSIIDHTSQPVRITPIVLSALGALHDRPRVSTQSTEFSFTRFLTPFLSGFAGWSLFMDCDMLVRADLKDLFALADDRYAVSVCKHAYTPRDTTKFLDQPQSAYEKKNWSSVMLFNNKRCRALTPEYVNSASGLQLHQFGWLASEEEIGGLPLDWNWLVGEYPHNPDARIAHFTRGGPYFPAYADCDFAAEWRATCARTVSPLALPGRPSSPEPRP